MLSPMSCLPAAASIERRLDEALLPRATAPFSAAPPSAGPYLLRSRPHAALFAAFNKRMHQPLGRARYVLISSTAKDRAFLLRDLNRLCPFRGWSILAYARAADIAATLAGVHAELADVVHGNPANR